MIAEGVIGKDVPEDSIELALHHTGIGARGPFLKRLSIEGVNVIFPVDLMPYFMAGPKPSFLYSPQPQY